MLRGAGTFNTGFLPKWMRVSSSRLVLIQSPRWSSLLKVGGSLVIGISDSPDMITSVVDLKSLFQSLLQQYSTEVHAKNRVRGKKYLAMPWYLCQAHGDLINLS
jgi:hypothetical protein